MSTSASRSRAPRARLATSSSTCAPQRRDGLPRGRPRGPGLQHLLRDGDCTTGPTTFTDETHNFISDGDPPATFPGTVFSPWANIVQTDGFPLSILDGGKAKGTWTLRVVDDTAGNQFALNCWQLYASDGRHPAGEQEQIGMIVIGIDPGAANTGFGVVRTIGDQMVALDGGVIETAPECRPRSGSRRSTTLRQLIDWHEPKAMALEDLFFGKNVGSALSVGQARGVAMLAAAQRGVPCFDYTPQAVKKAVCGSGAADKGQVQQMVASLLGLPEPPTPDHAADAFAVAICHAGGAAARGGPALRPPRVGTTAPAAPATASPAEGIRAAAQNQT